MSRRFITPATAAVFGRELGSTTCSVVQECTLDDLGVVACKMSKGNISAYTMRELAIYKIANGKGLARVHRCSVENETTALYMDLGFPLSSMLLPSSEIISLDTVCSIAESLLLCIKKLHAAGVAHGDIKPQNILLTTGESENHVCFIDAGMCISLGLPLMCSVDQLTTWTYKPPEHLFDDGADTNCCAFYDARAADMWAIGLVIAQMAMHPLPCSELPWASSEKMVPIPLLMLAFVYGSTTLPCPTGVSEQWRRNWQRYVRDESNRDVLAREPWKTRMGFLQDDITGMIIHTRRMFGDKGEKLTRLAHTVRGLLEIVPRQRLTAFESLVRLNTANSILPDDTTRLFQATVRPLNREKLQELESEVRTLHGQNVAAITERAAAWLTGDSSARLTLCMASYVLRCTEPSAEQIWLGFRYLCAEFLRQTDAEFNTVLPSDVALFILRAHLSEGKCIHERNILCRAKIELPCLSFVVVHHPELLGTQESVHQAALLCLRIFFNRQPKCSMCTAVNDVNGVKNIESCVKRVFNTTLFT